jgi:hypothetical protein
MFVVEADDFCLLIAMHYLPLFTEEFLGAPCDLPKNP